MVGITEEQKQIVKDTWDVPKQNPIDSGEAIFIRFLEKYPHNKEKFAAFRNIPLMSLRGNPGIRAHAARIVKVFQAAVDAFDSSDPEGHLQQVWTKVAVTHSHHLVQKEAFLELQEAVLEVLTKLCSLDETQQEAWAVLFEVVYEIVFQKLDEIYEN